MFSWVQIGESPIYKCELILPATTDIGALKQWLFDRNAAEIVIYEVTDNSEKSWKILFSANNLLLVANIQKRCQNILKESLEQKDLEISKLIKNIRSLVQKNKDASRSQFESTQSELRNLKMEVTRLCAIESQYHSLSKAYRLQTEEMKNFKRQDNESCEINFSSENTRHIPVDICIVCGASAMPSQGICLDCSR
jgi:hypothetical protein